MDPDPDPDPGWRSEWIRIRGRGHEWIRIRRNVVDPDPDPQHCFQVRVEQNAYLTLSNNHFYNLEESIVKTLVHQLVNVVGVIIKLRTEGLC